MTRFRVGISAVLACMAALAVVPSAFAHHGRISGSMDCQGAVSFTASAWQTSSVQAKTHNDVRVYVTQSNGAAVNPAQQVGNGQFNSANGFAFSGSFTVPAGVNSVQLLVKEIGPWANGAASSNGTNPESSITVARPTSGCAPPPPQCPTATNAQLTSSSDIGIASDTATVSFTIAAGCADIKLSLVSYKAPGPVFDDNTADQQTVHDSKTVVLAAGNHTLTVAVPACYYQVDFVFGDVITKLGPAGSSNFYSAQGRLIKAKNGGTASCTPPPPPPTDVCPNIEGIQTSVPAGMIKDANGNCVTPPTIITTVESPPAVIASLTAAPVATPAVVKPAAKPAPKAKTKVKKKAKVKKKVAKKKKKAVVKQQVTAKKVKPGALPFTP